MSNSTSPIKRNAALVQFSREHHFGLLLVWKIRQGLKMTIAAERISNYVLFFFSEEVAPHFKEEEEDLFVKLSVDDALRIQAFAEHEEIYKLIGSIQNDKQDVDVLNKFADSLDKHIRFEERTLFNHLQETLSEDELKKLEDHHSKREGDVDNKWEDHFWEKK